MKWYFPPLLPGQVENEVTQRDQFSNDSVDISETIVREAVQNSLDAAIDENTPVVVSFRWVTKNENLDPLFCKELLDVQLDHAREAGLGVDQLDFSNPVALVIEDFGTKGLVGDIDAKDDKDFSDFWRRHGKSHKTGRSRGRWGLGKLVYSITSQVGAFFGTTIRTNDPIPRLMGQTVLNLRSVDGVEYSPHAFFADVQNEEDIFRALPVPVEDHNFVRRFTSQFCLERTDEPGLSVVIPFPNPSFSREHMVAVAIINYFYPVITNQLKLRFNGSEISSENIRALAHEYASRELHDIDPLFDFIEGVRKLEEGEMLEMKSSWANDHKLDEDDFVEEDLVKIRKRFEEGRIVGLRLPVSLTEKDGTIRKTSFAAFVQRPGEIERGMDLYVRGGLTLPGEAKFKERKAFGAMIAEEESICSFLGDAENAAHTLWIGSAEKVKRNYRNPRKTVKVIKSSVVELYDLLAQVTDEIDEQALQSFLWTDELESAGRRRRPVKTPLVIPPMPQPKPQLFRITAHKGGFTVASNEQASSGSFPRVIRIEAAYDVTRGNAFKKYSALDFTMGKPNGIRLVMTKKTADVVDIKNNIARINVKELPFKLEATGFDENRDLKVRLISER